MVVHAVLNVKLGPSRIRVALKGLSSSTGRTIAKLRVARGCFNSSGVTIVMSRTRLDASRAPGLKLARENSLLSKEHGRRSSSC